MTARLSVEELSKALGVKPRQVSYLIKNGMPRDDIEAAKKWKEERQAPEASPLPAALDGLDDGTLATTIGLHRRLVATAQGVWESAMSGGDPHQGKYQTQYNQSLKTLINLEEEQERRVIASQVFIKREVAEASVREFAAEVLGRLDKVALEVAEKANPDNPALAAKVLEAWVRGVRADLSSR